MAKAKQLVETMRGTAKLLEVYSELIKQRVTSLLESRQKKLEFEALVRRRRGGS